MVTGDSDVRPKTISYIDNVSSVLFSALYTAALFKSTNDLEKLLSTLLTVRINTMTKLKKLILKNGVFYIVVAHPMYKDELSEFNVIFIDEDSVSSKAGLIQRAVRVTDIAQTSSRNKCIEAVNQL